MQLSLQKLQNKRTISVLGIIIVLLFSLPIVILAMMRYNQGYAIERIYFESHDKKIIAGLLYKPDPQVFSGKRPGIICLHDFFESKESVDRFSEDLVRAGFVVLAYDQRSFGNSEGSCHLAHPSYEIKDLDTSILYLKSLSFVNSSTIGVMGIGYGGAVAIMGAGILGKKINATFSINAYTNVSDTFKQYTQNSIQGNLMMMISKYIGVVPSIYYPNTLTQEQALNLQGFLSLIGDIPSLSSLNKFMTIENNLLTFNLTAMNVHSPAHYSASIPNNSLFLAAGELDQTYPLNASSSLHELLEKKYGIQSDFRVFKNSGHFLENLSVDNALVNFFNLELRGITPTNNDLLMNPYIREIDQVLTFQGAQAHASGAGNVLFSLYFSMFKKMSLFFLIPYVIAVFLLGVLLVGIYHMKEDIKVTSLKSKVGIKKERKKIYATKKMIVRRIEMKRTLGKPREIIAEDNIDQPYYLTNKTLGILVLILTNANLIFIPLIGMSVLNSMLLFIWTSILIITALISLLFFTKFERWKWKVPKSREDVNDKENGKSGKQAQELARLGSFLRRNPFYQVLLYLTLTFLVVFLLSLIITSLPFSLIDIGLAKIISTIIITSISIFLLGILLLYLDKKYLNTEKKAGEYGLSIKKSFKGACLGIYAVQIPLLVWIIANYVLIQPQPFLSPSYSFVLIFLPFIFLFFLGFELIFRSLIESKIRGTTFKTKLGEFLISSLFYAQFMALFGYLLFMNAYPSILLYSGVPVSYSGIFGLSFALFAVLGTVIYMITRTPVAVAVTNTLIFIVLIAVLI